MVIHYGNYSKPIPQWQLDRYESFALKDGQIKYRNRSKAIRKRQKQFIYIEDCKYFQSIKSELKNNGNNNL